MHPRDVKLQELYDQVPGVDCQRKCWTSCGPIDMSDRERHRIRKAGVEITRHLEAMEINAYGSGFWCEALTPDGSCGVYKLRPMICRLWGTSEAFPCPYGCVPERWLSVEEADDLLFRSIAAGGSRELPNVERMTDEQRERFIEGMQKVRGASVRRGIEGDRLRQRLYGGLPGPAAVKQLEAVYGAALDRILLDAGLARDERLR